MSTVSLTDADGLDPLPICHRNREWLIDYYKSPEGIVLRFFSDATPVRQRDKDFPMSWIRRYDKGRVFYSAIGHGPQIFWNASLLEHFLAGIQYALGDLQADDTPSGKLSGTKE